MAEKTLPWWRKALSYALEGIRSGFGLFTRTPKPAPPEPPPPQEKPEEELEKERLLPQQPDNPKTEAVVLTVVPEPIEQVEAPSAVVPEPAEQLEATQAVVPEPVQQPEAAPAIVPEPVQQAEDTPATLPVLAPEVAAVVEPAETSDAAAAPETAAATVDPTPQPDESASPTLEPIPEPVFDPIFGSPAEPDETVAQEVAEPKPEADPEPHPSLAEPEEQPSIAEPEEEISVTHSEEQPSLVEAEELPSAAEPEDQPTIVQADENLPAAESTEQPSAAKPEEDVSVTQTEEHPSLVEPEEHLSDSEPEEPPSEVEQTPEPVSSVTGRDFSRAEDMPITAWALAPEERVVEVAPEPALAADPPSDSTPSAPYASVEDSAESLQSPEPAGAADELPVVAQAEPEPETPHTEELTAEPVTEPSPEAQPAQPADLVETAVIEPPNPETAPTEQPVEPTAELEGTAEQAQAEAPVVEPPLIAVAEVVAPLEAVPAPEPAPPPVIDEKAAARLAARQKKLTDADEQSPFSVMVDHVYDGPLDLLLDLIRKQDIDIYDIPISKITSQFLAYVNQLRAGDVDVAGEFIYIASLLIHIKSKMLLPRAPAGPEDTPEDPRRELVERLLEHERFKNAAQMLQQKQMLEAASWTNPGAQEFKDDEAAEPEIAADTVDLVRIFRDILERARTRPTINVTEDQVTVAQMIQFLARRLTMEDKPVALRRLLSHTRSERSLIAMFLALLELVRLQAILLRQDRAFSEIFIKKHTSFDSVMNEGLVNARDDWK